MKRGARISENRRAARAMSSLLVLQISAAVVAVQAPWERASDFLADGIENANTVEARNALVARTGVEDGAVIRLYVNRGLRTWRADGPTRESTRRDGRRIIGIIGFGRAEAERMIRRTTDASVRCVARTRRTISSADEFGCACRAARRARQSAPVVGFLVGIPAHVAAARCPEGRADVGRNADERRCGALEARIAVGTGRAADVRFGIVTPANPCGRRGTRQRAERRAPIGRAFRRAESRTASTAKTNAGGAACRVR